MYSLIIIILYQHDKHLIINKMSVEQCYTFTHNFDIFFSDFLLKF